MAVLMDATIIRATLVPAFMRLAGDANWWAPPFMRRIYERWGVHDLEGYEPELVPTVETAEELDAVIDLREEPEPKPKPRRERPLRAPSRTGTAKKTAAKKTTAKKRASTARTTTKRKAATKKKAATTGRKTAAKR